MSSDETPIPTMLNEDQEEGKGKKKRVVIIIVILALLAGIIAFIAFRDSGDEDPQDEGQAQTSTSSTPTDDKDGVAPTIGDDGEAPATTSRTPEDQQDDDTRGSSSKTPKPATGTKVLPDGSTSTFFRAPDHITEIPNDVEVNENLARHQPGDPLPADPREAIIPTITAPTSGRYKDMEGPNVDDPAQAPPAMLASNFSGDVFSLCVKKNNSYNKNFREKHSKRATPEFVKRGLGSWAGTDHNMSWKVYENEDGCNSLISYPRVKSRFVGGENIMYYEVEVRQRVSDHKGFSRNLTPFNAHVRMKYVNKKWLVDGFDIIGGKLPVIR